MQKALVIQGAGEAKVVTDAPIPKTEKDFIEVKTVAVALNPSDWKHIDWRADKGAVVGFDYAGYIEGVGPDVKKPFQKGDRVLGFTHGCKSLIQSQRSSYATSRELSRMRQHVQH
jgi:NADPH:quinone reductase-like Zn-dependent oxidoreductase